MKMDQIEPFHKTPKPRPSALANEQRRAEFLKMYLDRPTGQKVSVLLAENKITRFAYYSWLKVDTFRSAIAAADHLRQTVELEAIERNIKAIVAVQIQKALNGDNESAKILLTMAKALNPKLTVDFSMLQPDSTESSQAQTLEEAIEAEEESRLHFDRLRDLAADEFTWEDDEDGERPLAGEPDGTATP